MQNLTHKLSLPEDLELVEAHLETYTRVRRCICPYDPKIWMTLLKDVHKTFGRPGQRWVWNHTHDLTVRPSVPQSMTTEETWDVVFQFRKESDAVLFSLKY